MKIILKNTNAYLLVILLYATAIGFSVLPFWDVVKSYRENPLGVWFSFAFCILILQIVKKSLPLVTFELSIFDKELKVVKWNYFSLKSYTFKAFDIEKITVSYGSLQKSQLILHLLNSKKLYVDLNFMNQREVILPIVELSQYAPNVENLKFALSVARLISEELNIPFESDYI